MFIYDIEIKKAIAKRGKKRLSHIQYCEGFADYKNMGIACICLYDYSTDKYRVFGEKELKEFQTLADLQDVAVGFNNIRFDNLVLKSNGVNIQTNKSFDILAEIQSEIGFIKGTKLDDVIKANFPNESGKSGSGADAPIWWQEGKYTKVIDYCLNDVRLTKKILDKIIRKGYINSPVSDQQLFIRRP